MEEVMSVAPSDREERTAEAIHREMSIRGFCPLSSWPPPTDKKIEQAMRAIAARAIAAAEYKNADEVAELVEALRPFAAIAERSLGAPFGDEHIVWVTDVHGRVATLTARAFRDARVAIAIAKASGNARDGAPPP